MTGIASRVVHSSLGRKLAGTALRWTRGQPLILFYHGVSTHVARDGLWNCTGKHVLQDDFVAHLKILRKTRRVIPLHQMVEGLRDRQDLRGTVAITFDDGYENNVLTAAPALADFDMTAAFFLTTGLIGTGKTIWTDHIEILLDQASVSSVSVPYLTQPVPLGSVEKKRAALEVLKAALKKLPNDERIAALSELEIQLKGSGAPPEGDYQFMNWDQARSLVNGGFEVGAHTINHPILSRIPLEEAKHEILGSRTHIANELGQCSSTFCYPNGKSSDFTQELGVFCRQHFRAALSANRGQAAVEELYELRRLGSPSGERVRNIEWMMLRAR